MSAGSDDLAARTEVRARVTNENIERGRDVGDRDTLVRFVCECGLRDCTGLIEITPAEYEAIRDHDTHFAIIDGHDRPDIEEVIERHRRYTVIAKRGHAGETAKARDPRS